MYMTLCGRINVRVCTHSFIELCNNVSGRFGCVTVMKKFERVDIFTEPGWIEPANIYTNLIG